MRLLLSSYAKTVPSNYQIKEIVVEDDIDPGESLDDEAWAKHERQCSPYYDWPDYQKTHEKVLDVLDHPEYAKRMREKAEIQQWSELLDQLEPFHL